MPSNFQLAPYACFADKSRGRQFSEGESSKRSPFQRDRDRILHSTSFRRLEYKTQVFVYNEGDHYRTRLTHSLEVAQLARSMCRIFKLDEDLSEAIALAHDMGHSPFGHAGEDALTKSMQNYGGFDHNAQSIKILTKLESKYIDYDGLNLSWECLEGIVKHNGAIKNPEGYLKDFNSKFDLELNGHPSLEAQIAAICDDVAYNSHDLEDGIRAELFTLDDIKDLPIIDEIYAELFKKHNFSKIEDSVLINEIRSRFIKAMLKNISDNLKVNLQDLNIKTVEEIRGAGRMLVDFDDKFNQDLNIIRKFLFANMYKHPKVLIMVRKARKVVEDLFDFYMELPQTMPTLWHNPKMLEDETLKAEIVSDFIAGMTDRYAFNQHKKIYDNSYTSL